MLEVQYQSDGALVLSKPVILPDVLDILVVGGGPAGTAAAFRAVELGLSVLVIDYDDLLKRIRDYPKDKLILPDFGGGDQMRFPRGGELISALHFAPIDKDDLVQTWKQLYVKYNVPARIGVELLALQRSDNIWQVKVWNHNLKAEQNLRARHVAIGIGRGVPRRFDIPGNTDGIAYRLADAQAYVSEPALVIGGGTSAAEAVIAISNAKVKAQESSAVYWSYRGDKLPKVSKALADVFFEAYMGNGNIRYFPNSEPVAVIAAEDGREYLSLRVDRKCIASRPNETQHLEFPKERCIACIGEDIPEAFLNSLGIQMVEGGSSKKKRMCVTRFLETQQSNVYLIGDILSQAYLETDDFAGDPATFREIKHRGNIKSGMIDGVLVAEVVAQRVAGKKEIDVKIEFADAAPVVEEAKPASPLVTILSAVTPAVEQPNVALTSAPRAALVRILAGGVEEEEYPLAFNGATTIGRKFCDIVFPDDPNLGDRHATISYSPDGVTLRDDASPNGVFLRLLEGKPRQVTDGDLLRVGRQFLLFRIQSGRHEIQHYDRTGKFLQKCALEPNKTVVLGREAPDITLDKADMTLSRRHLSIGVKSGAVLVKDLKSVNGTFLRVRNVCTLELGDIFRVGSQAFKLIVREEKPVEKLRITTQAPAQVQNPAPNHEMPQPSGPTVTFVGVGKTCSFESGQTICTIAERNGIKIVAECHAGICGSDPIRVISGKGRLNAFTAEEKGTLEDICGLSGGEYRLACMAKPTGTVEVEILTT